MSYRKDPFVVGEFYHVYNRGNSKQSICNNDSDFKRLQQMLFLCNSQESISVRDARKLREGLFSQERSDLLVAIGAYCLMRNHYHLLVTPLVEGGLSQFMLKLGTGYAMYFNKKYERTGSLFEGKFKAKLAQDDRYLKYLFAYIHLNPVAKNPRQGLGTALSYQYSSLQDYIDTTRDEEMILQPEYFPKYFINAKEHSHELNEWLQYDQ